MGIFDALTGAAGHAAAGQTRNSLSAIYPNLISTGQDAYRQSGDLLGAGYGQARTDLGTGYDAAGNAIRSGTTGAQGYLDQARAGYGGLTDLYGRGANLYADSMGLNGPEGNARAVSAFQAGPGYEFTRDEGIRGIAGLANAAGGLGGNSLRDAARYATNLADTTYGNWRNQLGGYNPLLSNATAGATGVNLANANLKTGEGNSLANLAQAYYGGLANNSVGGGTAQAANTIGGLNNYQSNWDKFLGQWNNTYKTDADASNSASANALNLGQNLLKLATGFGGGSNWFGGGTDPVASTGGVRWIS